jgi:LysM repeat protein
MAEGSPARVAAPLALIAAAVGVVVVVAASRPDSAEAPTATRTSTTQPARRRASRPRRRVYVVKAGDTLTVIAERTGVSLETIERLNPDVDPQALQMGQRLVLSP